MKTLMTILIFLILLSSIFNYILFHPDKVRKAYSEGFLNGGLYALDSLNKVKGIDTAIEVSIHNGDTSITYYLINQ